MPTTGVDELLQRVREIARENEQLFERLVSGERRYRGLARAVWRVQEAERRRIARELHDGIGQTLTALKNQLESLARRTAANGPPDLAELREAVAVAARALEETRELSRLLRPPVLDDLGLPAALRWLARSIDGRGELRVELALPDQSLRFDPELETLVFRVVQEALQNVEKHARATRATVTVAVDGGRLRVAVRDDGCGFDLVRALSPDRGDGGLGLRGMRDRADLFGGRLHLDSAPGTGTVVEIELPLESTETAR